MIVDNANERQRSWVPRELAKVLTGYPRVRSDIDAAWIRHEYELTTVP